MLQYRKQGTANASVKHTYNTGWLTTRLSSSYCCHECVAVEGAATAQEGTMAWQMATAPYNAPCQWWFASGYCCSGGNLGSWERMKWRRLQWATFEDGVASFGINERCNHGKFGRFCIWNWIDLIDNYVLLPFSLFRIAATDWMLNQTPCRFIKRELQAGKVGKLK